MGFYIWLGIVSFSVRERIWQDLIDKCEITSHPAHTTPCLNYIKACTSNVAITWVFSHEVLRQLAFDSDETTP